MAMAKSGRVGVIGGGLGGLAAACTLAARGYSVTLLEKSHWLGGKATVFEANGYRFDMGPTILTLPSVLRRVFAEAGRRLEDTLKLSRLDPQWRCFYADGATLGLSADRERMSRALEAFAPGRRSAEGYGKFLEFSKRLHDISERFFFWRSVGSIGDMFDWKSLFNPSMLRAVLGMRLGKTVAECVRTHVSDERIAQMLDHFTQYVGSAPDASPAVLCSIAHMQTNEGIWYPDGGTSAVPTALAKLAKQLGVELRTGIGVRRILLDDTGAVAGLETDSAEQIPFAAIISNMDSVRTHRELLAGTKAAARFEKRRSYEPACSGVVLYLGLDRTYEHLAHHNFIFSRNAEEEFETIYRRGELAPAPTCYVCAPSRTEPQVAPPGGEALYILVHTPYLRKHHDWGRMYPEYRRTILRKLADTAGLTDLESHIRFEDKLTPKDIHERYRVLDGAIYGLASHGRLRGGFKPANRSRDVKGLYLAGGAAHPGPGMPMVLMSGWIAADALDKDEVVPRSPLRDAPRPHVTSLAGPMPASKGQTIESAFPRWRPWLIRSFTRYARHYLSRNFHALRLAKQGTPSDDSDGPLIIVLNHPSWWDPLICIALAELFPNRAHYAPMDASALEKYRFFKRLGFYGVEQGTLRGAVRFLENSLTILSQPNTAIWVTAQGRFTDPRARPVFIRSGVANLARRLKRGVILPLAVEYPFWEERCPEALACFGEPISLDGNRDLSVGDWTTRIEAGLNAAQEKLAADAMKRDPSAFAILLNGTAGVGGVYDLWRRFQALLRGERFRPAHGDEARMRSS